MTERIKLNTKRFYSEFLSALATVSFVSSFILLFFDKEDFGLNTMKLKYLCIGGLLLVSLGWAFFRTAFYRETIIKKESPVIKVEYSDIWKEAFPKSSKEKRIVVINVNTTFDVMVDEDTVNIKKPLVSPTTLHGQLITHLTKRGITREKLSEDIKRNLTKVQQLQPVRTIDQNIKLRGELNCYEKGTIAAYNYGNTIFYLLAFSEFDENNNAQNSKDEMVRTVTKLVEFYNQNGQGYDMYVPLMGAGMSRTGITKADSLKILRSIFDIYNDKLQGNVHILVYEKDRDEVAIDV